MDESLLGAGQLVAESGEGATVPAPVDLSRITEALLAWKQACKKRVCCPDGQSLSPMDEMMWFATPTETYVAVASGTLTPILEANPMRVGFVVSVSLGPGDAQITTNAQNPLDGVSGLTLSATLAQPLVILQRDLGPLAQVAWYATCAGATASAFLTIIEIVLRAWPEGKNG